LIHALARLGIAFTWMWQALVPKLLFANVDEQTMIVAAGLPLGFLPALGLLELACAVFTLGLWRWRPFFLLNGLAMIGALIAVGLKSPSYLVGAFNPVTLNAGVVLLSIIGYFSSDELPSASRCLRRAPKETP
jgi:hypothetical protein